MKKKFVLIFFLLVLLAIAPVSAAFINTTQLGISSAGIYHSISVPSNGYDLYSPTLDLSYNPAGEKYAVVQNTYKLTNDNTILSTIYTFANGQTVTITTESVTTGLITAEYHVSVNGTSSTIPYTMWIPWSGSNAPELQTRFIYSNQTKNWYLYTGIQGGTGNPLDTSSEAYAIVSRPGLNPIASVSQGINSGGTLQATYLSVLAAELNSDTQKTQDIAGEGTTTTTWPEALLLVLSRIKDAILSLGGILGQAVGLLNITTIFFLLFTSAQVFLGINLFYMSIAILLSIEDSDDIFRAFGSFMRRMMKLFRFYMELFMALKEIIKWW
jgi:hypothetical protein